MMILTGGTCAVAAAAFSIPCFRSESSARDEIKSRCFVVVDDGGAPRLRLAERDGAGVVEFLRKDGRVATTWRIRDDGSFVIADSAGVARMTVRTADDDGGLALQSRDGTEFFVAGQRGEHRGWWLRDASGADRAMAIVAGTDRAVFRVASGKLGASLLTRAARAGFLVDRDGKACAGIVSDALGSTQIYAESGDGTGRATIAAFSDGVGIDVSGVRDSAARATISVRPAEHEATMILSPTRAAKLGVSMTADAARGAALDVRNADGQVHLGAGNAGATVRVRDAAGRTDLAVLEATDEKAQLVLGGDDRAVVLGAARDESVATVKGPLGSVSTVVSDAEAAHRIRDSKGRDRAVARMDRDGAVQVDSGSEKKEK